MSKPTELPRWGETTLEVLAPDVVEPSSGIKDSGYLPGIPSVISYGNWLFWVIWKWVRYLNAGAFEGNHSIAGDLAVTGDLSATGTLDVGGELTLGDDLTMAVDKSIKLQGLGKLYHSGELTPIHGCDFQAQNPATDVMLVSANGIVPVSASAHVYHGIELLVGRRILGITAFITSSASSGTRSITLLRRQFPLFGGDLDSLETASSTAVSSDLVLQLNDDQVISSQYVYSLDIGLREDDELQGVSISWDYPAP